MKCILFQIKGQEQSQQYIRVQLQHSADLNHLIIALLYIFQEQRATMSNENVKIYKFVFTALVKTVALALKFPCVVSVIWKRGQKSAQVKQRKQIDKGVITFNQNLQIQCNMNYDQQKKVFLQKKTKFTILIFSEKGNKQAGQVNLDVAQLLNAKTKQLKVQKLLQKCPDKKATLSLVLSGYMKEEISPDLVSKKSDKTINMQSFIDNKVQPDFKKKKKDESGDENRKAQVHSPLLKIKSQKLLQNLSKQNVSKIKLQEENRQLKEQFKQLKDLQIQNQNLKRKYQQADKKALSYYKKKYEQMKIQYQEQKQKAKELKLLIKQKDELQRQMCQCKQKMGRILNFAILSGNSQMSQQFYNIYQG